MNMDLMIYGSLILEVLGILICLKEFFERLIQYKNDKRYYIEYKNNIDSLISDMVNDGYYKTKEEVDINKLIFAMEIQITDSKKAIKKPIIGLIIMIIFLIRTITIM